MAISSHRNESSLQSYHSMPSVNQLRNCSDILSTALGDVDRVQTSDQPQNAIVRYESGKMRPPLQQLPVNTISAQHNTSSAAYSQMFNTYTIENVYITFNR
ncbi:hypothetical protein OS493_016747 [Desmophyllum pertusum]|uniref:Uncharacterized protein n=1 Tax=Desmophyllum pertusum TaxID=174260 RepID=A0A9X0CTD6_9CNID|nr:hypothetical protein OS493_016747 [Desmophyllum pertusum]